jgi:hypothetical protein
MSKFEKEAEALREAFTGKITPTFESKVMTYLKNLTSKFYQISERLDKLEKIMMSGFQATGVAFHQTKEVVNRLAEATEDTRMDLAEYGGVIEGDSFF